MPYRDILCVSISKMCPTQSEKPWGFRMSVNLDVMKHFGCEEQYKGMVCTLHLPASTIPIIYTHGEEILKAVVITMGPSSNKVVSFPRHPAMGEMDSLLLEWTDECAKWARVCLSYPPCFCCIGQCDFGFRCHLVSFGGFLGGLGHSKMFLYKL